MGLYYATGAIGAVGAGVQSSRTPIPTPFDQRARKVVGVKCTNNTKGVQVILDVNGVVVDTIDLSILNQVLEFAPTDYDIPVNIQLSFAINNTTGGAIVAGDFVTLKYATS